MSRNVFNNIVRGAGVASAGVIFALAGSPAWAAATVCTVVPSNATWDATVAVASNFYGPMQDLIGIYTTSPERGAGKHIRICHNSTGTLTSEITGGNTNQYSLFLAANATAPAGLSATYIQTGATAKTYAFGIPVMVALPATISNVSGLVTTTPALSGVAANITANDLSPYTINLVTAPTVAVAKPAPAPYGNAAFKIMSDKPSGTPGMGLVSNYVNPGDEPPAGDPSVAFLSDPYYDNIDLTLQSVDDGTNKSGFVSKGQICGSIGGGSPAYVYVQFTGSNYLLDQRGILIKSGDPTVQDPIGADIFDYMLNNPHGPTTWPSFLSAHCYM
ncbi:substrate-binding domain-containing protein [Nitrobacter sp. 62-23]|uniref:substrate-binding domain-containing protein n=1 Tax=Nitrobacter sp. 62-23 TaxID=1895798 RepID=UPI0025F33465|nr:substrate-binding domain-containing protein [Nitrobacter sp. 62-23]